MFLADSLSIDITLRLNYTDCALCPKFILIKITAIASYYGSDSHYTPIEKLISQA